LTGRAILEKTGKFKGRLRKQETRWIAGEKTKEVLYRENDCVFRFNIDKTYFSPRLSNERKEIASLIKSGNVLVMLGTFLPLSILVIIENPEQWIYGAVGIMLTMMITGTIIEGKNKKEILSTQQKAFYNFYNVYDSLRKYCDIPDDKRTMKITLSILNRFSNYIYGWAGKESPKEISELPKSIYKNTHQS